jgi:hypothetical protein
MFDTARAFAMANLRAPSHGDDELKVRLFLRTYGGDFDPATAQRIAAWFSTPGDVSDLHFLSLNL